jgi:hypothetical protein
LNPSIISHTTPLVREKLESEVGLDITESCSYHIHIVDKEMEEHLQEMIEVLLPGQAEQKADINLKIEADQEEIRAPLEKANAEANARQDQLK